MQRCSSCQDQHVRLRAYQTHDGERPHALRPDVLTVSMATTRSSASTLDCTLLLGLGSESWGGVEGSPCCLAWAHPAALPVLQWVPRSPLLEHCLSLPVWCMFCHSALLSIVIHTCTWTHPVNTSRERIPWTHFVNGRDMPASRKLLCSLQGVEPRLQRCCQHASHTASRACSPPSPRPASASPGRRRR